MTLIVGCNNLEVLIDKSMVDGMPVNSKETFNQTVKTVESSAINLSQRKLEIILIKCWS